MSLFLDVSRIYHEKNRQTGNALFRRDHFSPVNLTRKSRRFKFEQPEFSVQCPVCRFFDVPVIFRFFFNLDAFALIQPAYMLIYLDRRGSLCKHMGGVKHHSSLIFTV